MKKFVINTSLSLVAAMLLSGGIAPVVGMAEEIKEGNDTLYIVEPGDTLSKIAEKYETNYETVHANNLDTVENPHFIQVGQKLLVGGESFLMDATPFVPQNIEVQEPVIQEEATYEVVETEPVYTENIEPDGNYERESSTAVEVVETTANDGSPQYAAEQMASATGTSVDTWLYIIQAESGNNPHIVNSIGCYGYFQIHPVHGMPNGASVDTQIQYAISVYNSQGFGAWEVM